MSRYTIAAVAGSLYIAASAFVVHSVGESYRDALRRERIASRTAAPEAPQVARGGAADKVEPPGPANAITPSVHPAPASGHTIVEEPKPDVAAAPPKAATGPGPAPEPKALASTTAARPTGSDEGLRGGSPAHKPPVDAQPGPLDPNFVWADSLDLARLTPQDEIRLGRELHKMVMTYNRRLETGSWEQRVEDVARPLLALRSRKEIGDYTFTILDSSAVNAFSHPGGYIYVSRGLFNLIGEDEDYALEFILGHEIAHVDLRHAVQCLEPANEVEKKKGLGTLPQFYLLIAFGYPDKMEYEADAWALKRMISELDRSRHDGLAFLRKLEGYARDNGFSNGRKLPPDKTSLPGEVLPPLVENHFRALTPARKRLSELKVYSETLTFPRK